MRKNFFYFLFFISSFLLINTVYAQNVELKLKKVDNVKLMTRDGRYDSAQAMTITNKYIVVVLASSDSSITNNIIYVYDKNTYKFIMRKEIVSCSHANGITYNKDNNTLVCADAHNKRFVIYDASNLSFKKFVYTNQPYNNIDYDSSRKNYWGVIDSNFATKWYKIIRFDENFNRITGGDIAYDTLDSYGFESSQKYRVNQDIVYKDNYLYLLNFVNNDNLHFYKPGFSNVKFLDAIILSYDVRTGKKGSLLFYHPTDEINELEDVAFDGEKPYFLFQLGGRFQLYTADYTPRNLNAKVNVSVNSNNNNLLTDAGLSANFSSNSSNFNLNKSVNYDNGYTLSNLNLNKSG